MSPPLSPPSLDIVTNTFDEKAAVKMFLKCNPWTLVWSAPVRVWLSRVSIMTISSSVPETIDIDRKHKKCALTVFWQLKLITTVICCQYCIYQSFYLWSWILDAYFLRVKAGNIDKRVTKDSLSTGDNSGYLWFGWQIVWELWKARYGKNEWDCEAREHQIFRITVRQRN